MKRIIPLLLLLGILAAAVPARAAPLLRASAFPSRAERAFWRVNVKKFMMRPGCCGACPGMQARDYQAVARVIRHGAKDTPATREIWQRYGYRLIFILSRQDPDGYARYRRLRLSEARPRRAAQEFSSR